MGSNTCSCKKAIILRFHFGYTRFNGSKCLFVSAAAFNHASDFISQLASRHNSIYEACLLQEFCALETFGEFLADCLLDDAWAGEADEGVWFGDDEVAQHCE